MKQVPKNFFIVRELELAGIFTPGQGVENPNVFGVITPSHYCIVNRRLSNRAHKLLCVLITLYKTLGFGPIRVGKAKLTSLLYSLPVHHHPDRFRKQKTWEALQELVSFVLYGLGDRKSRQFIVQKYREGESVRPFARIITDLRVGRSKYIITFDYQFIAYINQRGNLKQLPCTVLRFPPVQFHILAVLVSLKHRQERVVKTYDGLRKYVYPESLARNESKRTPISQLQYKIKIETFKLAAALPQGVMQPSDSGVVFHFNLLRRLEQGSGTNDVLYFTRERIERKRERINLQKGAERMISRRIIPMKPVICKDRVAKKNVNKNIAAS